YLFLKVPYNFLRNVLGIFVWTNTVPYAPRWSVELPRWLQFGKIREIGLVTAGFDGPSVVLRAWLTSFGIAPVMLLTILRRARKRINWPTWLRIAWVYGWAMFFLAPCFGHSIDRLVSYAWPAFWIVLPVVFVSVIEADGRTIASLIALQ